MKCEVTTASLSNMFVRKLFFIDKNQTNSEPAVDYDRFVFVSNGEIEVEINKQTTSFVHPHVVFIPSNTKVKYKALSDSSSIYSLYVLHDKNTKQIIDPASIPNGVDLSLYDVPRDLLDNEYWS